MFVAPSMCVPFIILSIYGIGFGKSFASINILVKIAIKCSFIRYSLEGVIASMLNNRGKLHCPETEDFCPFHSADIFLKWMGLDQCIYWIAILGLFTFFLVFRGVSFYILRQRLKPGRTFRAVKLIFRVIKDKLNISKWKLKYFNKDIKRHWWEEIKSRFKKWKASCFWKIKNIKKNLINFVYLDYCYQNHRNDLWFYNQRFNFYIVTT